MSKYARMIFNGSDLPVPANRQQALEILQEFLDSSLSPLGQLQWMFTEMRLLNGKRPAELLLQEDAAEWQKAIDAAISLWEGSYV